MTEKKDEVVELLKAIEEDLSVIIEILCETIGQKYCEEVEEEG